MMYFSQLRQNEDIYYIDLSDLSKGVMSSKVISAEYKHDDSVNFGCGCIGPEDTWTIHFNMEAVEREIQVHHANIYYQYFDFTDLKNVDGRALVNKYHYLVSGDKDELIKKIKKDTEKSVDDAKDKIAKWTRALNTETIHLATLENYLKIINEKFE